MSAPASSATPAAGPGPEWRGALSAWLAAHKRYPEAARQRGEEGVVGVSFQVDRDGRITSVAIIRSSGSSVLDGAAQDMLAGQRVPAPTGMVQPSTTVSVNIRYALDR